MVKPGAEGPADTELVTWIRAGTSSGPTVLSAIPAGFEKYATIVVPEDDAARRRADSVLIRTLEGCTEEKRWWLGYLDTGNADVVAPAAERVLLYAGWRYVLLAGSADDALTARSHTPWSSAVPELVAPIDRSWLLSKLWDDDWRCIGGPAWLVDTLLRHTELEIRPVTPSEDMTPPGHVMR